MRPILLTSGEPAGVAPEITLMAWTALRHEPQQTFALIGDAAYWRQRNPGAPIHEITALDQAASCFAEALPVLHRPLAAPPLPGTIHAATAPQVIAAIDEAVALAFAGDISALGTNPLHKDSHYAAVFLPQGHPYYLAHLSAAYVTSLNQG